MEATMTVPKPSPRAILLAGWAVFLLYAWPGYMTTDAIDMMIDAGSNQFTDWHSPTMTLMWRYLGLPLAGPPVMLLLQSGLFLAGGYGLLRRALPDRAAAAVTAGLLVFPPVLSVMAVVWPDALLASLLLCTAALVGSDARGLRIVGLACAVLAGGMRYGAALAVLPIVALGFTWRADLRPWPRRAIALGVWAICALASWALDRELPDLRTRNNEIALAAYDVVGTIRWNGEASDADLRDDLAGAPLAFGTNIYERARRIYPHPGRLYIEGPSRVLDAPNGDDAIAALVAARDHFAFAHPFAYLKHRFKHTWRLLGLGRARSWRAPFTDFVEGPSIAEAIRFRAHHSPVQRALIWLVERYQRTLAAVPALFAALAIGALGFAIRRRDRMAGALAASAVLYELALAFTTSTVEYRFACWLVVASLASVAILVARRGVARAR
jgi:hypothetical protein